MGVLGVLYAAIGAGVRPGAATSSVRTIVAPLARCSPHGGTSTTRPPVAQAELAAGPSRALPTGAVQLAEAQAMD